MYIFKKLTLFLYFINLKVVYNLNNTKPRVSIDSKMRNDAYNFANLIENQGNQFRRLNQSLEESIETTYIGKLGELAFRKYLIENNIYPNVEGILDIYEGQTNVDDFDFKLKDGITIDVKTGYLKKHKRLMVNEQQLKKIPKNIYVGIKLFPDSKFSTPTQAGVANKNIWTTAEIEGWAFRDDLVQAGSRNWGKSSANAILYSDLNDINVLLPFF